MLVQAKQKVLMFAMDRGMPSWVQGLTVQGRSMSLHNNSTLHSGNLEPTCVQKQKQQYGPGAGGAVDLDPALEAAYKQFGKALGEAPRETAKIVQQKLGLEQEPQRPSGSQVRSTQQQRSQQRYVNCSLLSAQGPSEWLSS